MIYGYSKKTNAFYLIENKELYEKYGSWPSDVKEIKEEIWEEFSKQGPSGKMCGADKKGMPCWVDIPPLTKGELILSAEKERALLLQKAKGEIEPLADAVELKIATNDEKEKLRQWKLYRVLLNRIDANVAPNIEWPEAPSNVA